jgi:hypothetical protein
VRVRGAITGRARTWILVGAAVVVAAGVLAALRADPDAGTQQVRTAAPSTTTIEETTTTTALPAPASSTTLPTLTTTTTAVPKPAPSPPSGTVATPYQSGRTSWSGSSNGVDLSLTVDNGAPRSGDVVTFNLTVHSATRKCCGFFVNFGDGSTFAKDNSCPGGITAPGTVTTKTTHVYNKPGRWKFVLTGLTHDCPTAPGEPRGDGTLSGWIEVAPGAPPTGQGPVLPTVQVDRFGPTPYDNDPSWITVFARASDPDGHITKLVVDYGDGTTEPFPNSQACRVSESGWPESSYHQSPYNPPAHHYEAYDTYTVTVTAYSQGCDGRDVQTATATLEVRNTAPPS